MEKPVERLIDSNFKKIGFYKTPKISLQLQNIKTEERYHVGYYLDYRNNRLYETRNENKRVLTEELFERNRKTFYRRLCLTGKNFGKFSSFTFDAFKKYIMIYCKARYSNDNEHKE